MPSISDEPHVGHSRSVSSGSGAKSCASAAALQPLAARVEIDLPAGELGREAHVLAVAADGERELVLVDDGLNGLASPDR